MDGFRSRSELEDIFESIEGMNEEFGKIVHASVDRLRPFPYDPSVVLTLLAGAGANNFGLYTELIPIGTYDFGDGDHNRIQIESIRIESMSQVDIYIMEFYKTTDAVEFPPLGAARVKREAALTRSFSINCPIRPECNTHYALYGRVKSTVGGNNITFSLSISRFLPTDHRIPISTEEWPTG